MITKALSARIGMWRWDGSQWQPTEKNLQASERDELSAFAEDVTNPGQVTAPGRSESPAVSSADPVSPTWAAAPTQAEPSPAVPSRAERRAEKKALRAARKEDAKARGDMLALARSPAGRARTAFERGDHIVQCSFDVMSQQDVIVSMVGSTTTKKTSDPTETLNSVCREGWELLNGTIVFIEEGQQSRDKFMSSGQNVATKGRTMGYYLFKRNEAMRADTNQADDLLDEALDEASEETGNPNE
jgi:hypothetical protein